MSKLLGLITIALALSESLALGPIGDVVISNAFVAPDGFRRAASVVNGLVDRTIIRATQVSHLVSMDTGIFANSVF